MRTTIMTMAIMAIVSPAVSNPLDLNRPGATGGTFVLADDLRRRAYAEREAKEALPAVDSGAVVRGMASHILNCLLERTGVDAVDETDPVIVDARRTALSYLVFECVGDFAHRRYRPRD